MLFLLNLLMILEIHLDIPCIGIIKTICAIAIELIDKALDKINSRDDPRESLDIYVESPLEVENDGDFNDQGGYYINTPLVPCSYEKSPDSLRDLSL